MKGPDRLRYFQDNWPTNKGAWYPGERVLYREKSLFDDFHDKPWVALLIYGVRSAMPDDREARLVEHVWKICTSYPDPRIWNNRVAALAGTARSTGALALAAATAVSEATIYGRKPDLLGSSFLHAVAGRGEDESLASVVLAYLKKYRAIPGFGRPLIARDERIGPLLKAADDLGLASGKFLRLVGEIEACLEANRYRLKANISIYCSALMADLGYTPREFYLMALLAFSAGIVPCYIDAQEKPEGALFPLTAAQIEYSGMNKRSYHNNES